MRSVLLAIGVFSIGYSWALVALQTSVEQSTSVTKPTPLILTADEGEQREFRTQPGVTFSIAIDDERLHDYPTRTGTSFLEAFQSCPLMKSGARRRINASCLD